MKLSLRPTAATLALAVAVTLTSAGAADAVRTSAPAVSPQTTVHSAATPQPAGRVIARNPSGHLGSRIVGHTASGRRVTGAFIPLHFSKKNGHVRVRGLLTGVVHRANGKVATFSAMRTLRVKSISGTPIRARSAAAAATSCNILNLVLAPLDLNLLGLQVHLDKVVLNVVAQSGAGNLLGNLLCAVAGLLDNGLGGLLGQLTGLLNQILAALRLGA